MKFGIFDHLERRPGVDLAQQYEERLQLLEQADASGIYGYHIAEHHHSPLCLAPNQAVFLAAVAVRTTRLRFGPLVYVLPLHHPIRLIEEICMVDQLSGGRFQIGVGRGTGGGTELAMWGGDPQENDALYEESLEIIRNGLTSEFLTHEGRFFNFKDVWMALRPRQLPHPPFWYAGNPEKAGRLGMNFIGAGSINGIARASKVYRESLATAKADGNVAAVALEEPLFGGMKHLFVAPTDEEARARALQAYAAYRTHFAKPTPVNPVALDRSSQAWQTAARRSASFRDEANRDVLQSGPAALDPAKALELGALLAGSPATVRRYVREYTDRSEANYFVGSFQWGDLTHAEASESLRLFTDEVAPSAT